MSLEEKRDIIKELSEVILHSHQSKDKEVSGLFQEIKNDMRDLKDSQQEFQDEMRDKFAELEKRAVKWDMSTKGFLSIVALIVTGFFGAVINFFIKHT